MEEEICVGNGRRIREAQMSDIEPDAKRQMSASPSSTIMSMDVSMSECVPPIPSADDVLVQVRSCRNEALKGRAASVPLTLMCAVKAISLTTGTSLFHVAVFR